MIYQCRGFTPVTRFLFLLCANIVLCGQVDAGGGSDTGRLSVTDIAPAGQGKKGKGKKSKGKGKAEEKVSLSGAAELRFFQARQRFASCT